LPIHSIMKEQGDLFSGLVSSDTMRQFLCNLPELAHLCLNRQGKVLQYGVKFNSWLKMPAEAFICDSIFELQGNEWLKEQVNKLEIGIGVTIKGTLTFARPEEKLDVAIFLIRIAATTEYPELIFGFVENFGDPESLIYQAGLDHANLQLIAEHAGDAISLHSLNGDFLYISPSVEKVHGYSPEELRTHGPMHAVHPEDVEIIHDVLKQISGNNASVKVRYRLIHKKGHIVWVESISHCIWNDKGDPSMISVITRDITASKIMEDAIRHNEEKYRTLVKNLPTGILLMNTKGEILEVNQALLDILGSPGEEPTRSINLFEFENLVDSGISDDLKKCINDRKVVNGQAEYLSKWGKRSYLLYSAVPIFSTQAEVYQVICNVRDITRIKKAEEKSQQQIDFLNVVINTMQEPFFVKDENHRWIMLNDAAVEMMGSPRESLMGKSDYDLYPKDQADIFWMKDSQVFEHGSNVNEEKINWSDGSERDIITYKRLYTESLTGKKYIVGTIHDITALKQNEFRVRESEKKYHELFDNANDYIFTTDLNGVFTNANKAMLNRIGISLSDIGKYSIFDSCSPEILEDARKTTNQLLSEGTVSPFEIITPELDGKTVTLEILARLFYENNKPVGIQGIARDISEKKLASQKLEQINKELQEMNASKDKFYSIIAHDLKNPFNSLIGFSELLLEDFDELSKDEMRDYVGIIRNTAKNSLILLENLLAWSRLQTGRMVYNPVRLTLANEIEATTTVLYSLSYRKKIKVDNLIEKSIFVLADQNMLHSIMHNLVMNAIKFTPHLGTITISCECIVDEESKSGTGIISVKDTGIGMSDQDQAKLFSLTKPFTMLGTEKESGTGLGLLLTREMVEKHGGTLNIKSSPGEGSEFSFNLPLFVP
jgi:PAS domain S-box-containing protein